PPKLEPRLRKSAREQSGGYKQDEPRIRDAKIDVKIEQRRLR
ncbi:uncharacterized protein METZ01_LOCUS312303, partial [marine metagenome]